MESIHAGLASAEYAALSAALDCYLDAVRDGLLSRATDSDLLGEVRDFETVRRRLIGFDLAALPELQRRGIPGLAGARSVAVLIDVLDEVPPQLGRPGSPTPSRSCSPPPPSYPPRNWRRTWRVEAAGVTD